MEKFMTSPKNLVRRTAHADERMLIVHNPFCENVF